MVAGTGPPNKDAIASYRTTNLLSLESAEILVEFRDKNTIYFQLTRTTEKG